MFQVTCGPTMTSGASPIAPKDTRHNGLEPAANLTAGPLNVLSRRERFLRACRRLPVDYPPMWLMRQAGRALPEYRALKEKYSFLQLVQTPELATEVTLQPIRRFDFDAGILFSDILVIPEALGQGYHFRETGGVQMEFTVQSAEDIARLNETDLVQRLDYVNKALRMLRTALGERTALMGFAGSPWTLANFMLEGGSAPHPVRTFELFRRDRGLFNLLMEKLTRAVGAYLRMQIEAGVDAVQIFDSHGGLLPAEDFDAGSGRWMRQIIRDLGECGVRNAEALSDSQLSTLNSQPTVPVIVFSKGTHQSWDVLANMGAQVIGVDWEFSLAEARRRLPETIGIQGNLEPSLLVEGTPQMVASRTAELLDAMRGRNGYIFNLGHGLPPNAKLENIECLIATVRQKV